MDQEGNPQTTKLAAQLKTYAESKNMVLPRDKFMRPIIPRQKMDHEDEA